MGFAYASGVVTADAAEVWPLVRRFDALPIWHPFVESCEMLNGDHPATVGSRRVQRLANGGDATAQLVSLDDARRTIVYQMLDGPWPVHNYVSTVRVCPITDQGTSFVEWWGRFDADIVDLDEMTSVFRTDTYEAGVAALQQWFGTGSSSSDRGPMSLHSPRENR